MSGDVQLLLPELVTEIFMYLSDPHDLYNFVVALRAHPLYKWSLHTKQVYSKLWDAQYSLLFPWLSICDINVPMTYNYGLFTNIGMMYYLYYKTLYKALYRSIRIKAVILRGNQIVQLYMINGNYIKSYIVPTFYPLDNGQCKVKLEFTLGSMMPLYKYFSDKRSINVWKLDKFFENCDYLFNSDYTPPLKRNLVGCLTQ